MNKWIKRVVASAIVAAQFLVIPAVSASSLENIQNQKQEVEAEVTQLQKDVNDKLAETSEISIALDKLRQEIEEHEASIVQTEEDIEKQEVVVQERYEYTADQLKALQTSEVNQNIVLSLLQAESLSDLVNKAYAATVLTGASEEHLNEAQAEQEKLDALKEELLVYKEELNAKQEETVQQQEVLETKLAELKTTLAASQDQLEELNAEEAEIRAEQERKRVEEEQRRAAEEQRKAAEQEQATTKVATAANNTSSNNTSSNNSNSNNSTTTASTPKPAQESSNQAGSWMSVQATGYSTQEAGLSTHTATGIDLRVNPRVIAVDPSIIPLGSLVEVQGMGVYVAGDTGGAINGRIIDIHFSSVSQALSWGRRTVNVRIIN